MQRVGIIGAGAWGTALALVCARAGNTVTLLTRSQSQAEEINTTRTNNKALPNLVFEETIEAVTTPNFLTSQDVIVLAVPAQASRQVAQGLSNYIPLHTPMILTAKGVEYLNHSLMTEVMEEILPQRPLAVLSGPTFAIEVAMQQPTAVTLATMAQHLATPLLKCFATPEFRPYLTNDIIGVQIGGAVKNVLAIASGIVMGKGLGDNARAALISRGLAELVRLGMAKGGILETFLGLSGCGDLVLTSTSVQSRNMRYGLTLGKGELSTDSCLKEGVATAQSVTELAKGLKVSMPICEAIQRIVTHQSTVDEEIKNLLGRPLHPDKVGEIFFKGIH